MKERYNLEPLIKNQMGLKMQKIISPPFPQKKDENSQVWLSARLSPSPSGPGHAPNDAGKLLITSDDPEARTRADVFPKLATTTPSIPTLKSVSPTPETCPMFSTISTEQNQGAQHGALGKLQDPFLQADAVTASITAR